MITVESERARFDQVHTSGVGGGTLRIRGTKSPVASAPLALNLTARDAEWENARGAAAAEEVENLMAPNVIKMWRGARSTLCVSLTLFLRPASNTVN